MSRTIRRKTIRPDKWTTHDRIFSMGSWVSTWKPKSCIDLAQSLAKFHGDHGYTTTACCGRGPGVAFRQNYQRVHRRGAKHELHKFYRDEGYEVQVQNNPYLPYWD